MSARSIQTLGAAAMLFAAGSGHSQYDLLASTFMGGEDSEYAVAMDVDAEGNIYLAGYTTSENVPNSVGALGGYIDGFVAKLSPDLSELYWFTYVGGSDSMPFTEEEWATDVVHDGQGGAIIVGKTRCHDFPTVNAIDDTMGGPSDAFVTRVDANGQIVFSTYLGGSFEEMADDRGGGQFAGEIELTSSGVIVIAGDTRSEDFPLVNPIDSTFGGFSSDVFVARLSLDGQQLLSSTYIGDLYRDEVWGMRLDAQDQPVIVGQGGPEWPRTPGAFAHGDLNSSGIVYITKLLADCSDYAWSSTIERVDDTGGHLHFLDAAIGTDGTVFAAGYATGGGFPMAAGAYQPNYTGGDSILEGYALGLADDGTAVVSGSWVGAFNTRDTVSSIDVAPDGAVIVGRDVLSSTGVPGGTGSIAGHVNLYEFSPDMTSRDSIINRSGSTRISVAGLPDLRTDDQGNVISVIYTGNLGTTPGAFQTTNPGGLSPLVSIWSPPSPDCLADTNGDGALTPADFTAWIDAFNNNLPACDQNDDGGCDPADFSAWIANYNKGC